MHNILSQWISSGQYIVKDKASKKTLSNLFQGINLETHVNPK